MTTLAVHIGKDGAKERAGPKKSQNDCQSHRSRGVRGYMGYISKRENALNQATEVMLHNGK